MKRLFVFATFLFFHSIHAPAISSWMGNLKIYDREVWPTGRLGNYGTAKYFLDESGGESIPITVTVEVYADGIAADQLEVQLYTNLNRRDYARVWESANDAGSPDSYYKIYPMDFVATLGDNYVYSAKLEIVKCGAYRLTARFRIDGGDWQWHNEFTPNLYDLRKQRDCAIVVSPKKTKDLAIYEVNSLVVEATAGGTQAERSTFEDFTDRDLDGFDPFNLEYITNQLGFNTVWLMPIFPITKERWDRSAWVWTSDYEPGSPYSTNNYWHVNPWLSEENTELSALDDFKYLVNKAEALGLNVFIDIAFNHAGRDVVYGEGAVDLGLCDSSEVNSRIRQNRPSWCSKNSTWANRTFLPHYREHASNPSECALWAPADRVGEHVWEDANVDWFFGDYSSLGPKPDRYYDPKGGPMDERDLFYTDLDPDGGYDFEVENVWNYFGHLLPYWLEVTDNKLDGIRADFAQGLPPRAWEYIINKTRQEKWDFIFLAEVLDPSQVLYRANRHFDVITTVDHYLYRHNDVTTSQIVASLEGEASMFGYNACIMHNGTSHDESGNSDQWAMVARYAVCGASYGVPMIFMGQPLGIPYRINFKDKWSNIQDQWNDANKAEVNEMYRRINHARETTPALRSVKRHFLRRNDGSLNEKIFAVARWEESSSPSIVIVFINLSTAFGLEDVFTIPDRIPLRRGTSSNPVRYQAFNLVSDNPTTPVWSAPRTADDILDNGMYVKFNYPNEVQYIKLEAID